ncbi:MAG: GntR family transcriptional regulator [Pseudomonadota bacterium]
MTVQQETSPKSVTEKGPLYRRIARLLKADIVGGVYAVGDLLPTEQDLCDRFGASRYTIREALRLLEEDAMVERRQGRGTEVISSTERPVFAQSLTSLSQLYDYAADTRLVIERVIRVVPDEDLAVQLGRLPGREWILAEGVRTTTGGQIICVSHVFIHQNFAAISPDLKTHRGAIHRLIEDRFDVQVAEVHQEISTVTLESTMAQILEQPRQANAILVSRRYLGHGDAPILVSFNWHRLDGFRYGQIIRRE